MNDETTEQIEQSQTYTMIGYGTFITKSMFLRHKNVRVVTIIGFRRIFDPKLTWFPFVLKNEPSSFKGIAFDIVGDDKLRDLDSYESVDMHNPTEDGQYGLYYRTTTTIIESDGTESTAWIYIPSTLTITKHNLSLDTDADDKWLNEIYNVLHRYPGDFKNIKNASELLPDEFEPKKKEI